MTKLKPDACPAAKRVKNSINHVIGHVFYTFRADIVYAVVKACVAIGRGVPLKERVFTVVQ